MIILKMVCSLSFCKVFRFHSNSCHNHPQIETTNGHVENGLFIVILHYMDFEVEFVPQ